MHQEIRTLTKQHRHYRYKMGQLEEEKVSAIESLTEIESVWKEKVSHLEFESKQLQR